MTIQARFVTEAVQAVAPGAQVAVGLTRVEPHWHVVEHPSGALFRVDYPEGATPQQVADGDALVSGWDLSAEAEAAREAAGVKAGARAFVDAAGVMERALRAFLVLQALENNRFRNWLSDFRDAVAAAGTLTALKTAVAALPDFDPLTALQVKAALKGMIDDDAAD